MISHQTTLEFGNGDIQSKTTILDGMGVLCMRNVPPHDIGIYHEEYEHFSVVDSDAVMIFKNTKSIDTFIEYLQHLKDGMGEKR